MHFLIKLGVFFAATFSSQCTNSQVIVPNPSFEDFIDFQNLNNKNWHKVQFSDTPDYFNSVSGYSESLKFDGFIGGTKAKRGTGFTGIFCYRVQPNRNIKDVREYIETPLNFELEKDSLYKVGFSLCLDAESNVAIKNFGILFSNTPNKYNVDFKMFKVSPQIEFNFSYIDSINQWITLQSIYKANGNENFLTIGNFKSDKNTLIKEIDPLVEKGKKEKWSLSKKEKAAYYYIDDVVLEKILIIPVSIPDDLSSLDTDTALPFYDLDKIEVDLTIILKNIIFEFDKSDLLSQSYNEIDKLYHLMNENPNIRVKLEGHTDNIGEYEYNLQLSIERVESVATYLISKGIEPNRIEFSGYGYSYPLVSNDNEEGRAINRRVSFKILQK